MVVLPERRFATASY